MNTRERHRSRLERRVFRARKINHRINERSSWRAWEGEKQFFENKKGRLSRRLIYENKPWWERFRKPSVSEQKQLAMIKSKMEDFVYEDLCEC